MRRLFQLVLVFLLLLLGAAAIALVWGRGQLRGSLPQLEGEQQLAGLAGPVRVTRDRLGIPTVRGATRTDVARATGFLHAQERFFQMDLSRRRAAGELSALVGARALALDREIRIHRFRSIARETIQRLQPGDRATLDAYSAGVNTGLEALDASPFEYLLLRQRPAPWSPEDSILVILSMFITLQDTDGSYEATLATMRDVLPPAMFEFLAPQGSEWDAPVVGLPFHTPAIPGPEVYDLRARRRGKPHIPNPESQIPNFERVRFNGPRRHGDTDGDAEGPSVAASAWRGAANLARHRDSGFGIWDLASDRLREPGAIGSNSFAVAGTLTGGRGALLANDMHLTIRVPNTWYRASLEWADPASPGAIHRVTGVTLPGVPTVVVGSNSHVAWGFTNTYADWSDIVLLEVDPARPDVYRTPDGWREFDRYSETVAIAGQPARQQDVVWTMWGPVLGPDHRGRPRAYRWVAHAADRLAVSVTPFESARTLDEAFAEANGLGTPGQNVIVADRAGRIGWTVYGAIPRRIGFDGRFPTSWADGSRGWGGWLADTEYPRLVDPAGGRLWTANARVVDGEMLATLGDGSYEIGSRARIIRDRLAARTHFSERDLLDIQLDTRAEFLARWRTLLLSILTPQAMEGREDRAALKAVVETGWSGQAAPDSAAYRLTRAFREHASERIMAFVLVECYEADRSFDYTTVRRRDAAIWRLATEQPQHLLDPQYATWAEMLLAAVDAALEQTRTNWGADLRERVWSEYNVVAFRHPLSAAVPLVGRWLDMPRAALPGDLYTPRVHWGAIGASERMVVSPGREAEGIMHMPTGQSGHPLSPFYANSHPAWVAGEPTPFLPGATVHTLTLRP